MSDSRSFDDQAIEWFRFMCTNSKKVLGVWDISKASTQLGSLIIFLEELLLFKQTINAEKIDVVFIQGQNSSSEAGFDLYLRTVISFLPDLESLFFFKSQNSFNEFIDFNQTSYEIWPPYDKINETSYAGSTISIQNKFKEFGEIALLKISADRKQYALNWLQRVAPNKLPVAVHLKNSYTDPKSNANADGWLNLFNTYFKENLPIKFILIGSDSYDPCYKKCSNVVLSQENKGDLRLDLSLIQVCFMFMGMASGPCNMALFSGEPYLIWKHPDHHTQEMDREFQGHSQFIFANENQKFMREWDTSANLIREFKELYGRLNKKRWFESMYEDKFNVCIS